jgi:NitT/TauT family transport system substrate-binding protein
VTVRKILSVIISCSLIYILQGCHKNSGKRIRIGYIPIADCAQLYVGLDKGYFQKVGIEVDLIKLAGGAKILEALAGGSIDIGFSNVVSLILANDAGLDFNAITGGPRANLEHRETGLLIKKDSKIISLKDLEGKTIAVNTKKNIVELLLLEYLQMNGVNISKIKLVEIPFPRMLQVLDLEQVDAIATIEPFVTFGLEQGGARIMGHYFTEVMPELEISTYNASEKWANSNHEIVNSFRLAIKEATIFANNNTQELIEIIAKHTNLSFEQVSSITLPYFGDNVDKNSLVTIISKVHSKGWIENELNPDSLIAK